MSKYSSSQFYKDSRILAKQITKEYSFIYGVPRGGVTLAIALSYIKDIILIDDLTQAMSDENVLVVDDIIDSGTTRTRYKDYDFACLHIKKGAVCSNFIDNKTYYIENDVEDWIHYWWEENEAPAEDAVIRIIQAIGDDPTREGLLDTPKRVTKSWEELFSGYKQNTDEEVKQLFTQFSGEGYNEIVLLKDIEFFSFCEHHLLPFFGKAHIAYIPKDKVVGISKLARLLDLHSRRLQIQERIGERVVSDIMKHLDAQGAACVIEAQHLCMKMRGVNKQHSVMITSSIKGAFMDNEKARIELMGLLR